MAQEGKNAHGMIRTMKGCKILMGLGLVLRAFSQGQIDEQVRQEQIISFPHYYCLSLTEFWLWILALSKFSFTASCEDAFTFANPFSQPVGSHFPTRLASYYPLFSLSWSLIFRVISKCILCMQMHILWYTPCGSSRQMHRST